MTKKQAPKHLSKESQRIWNNQVTSEVPECRLKLFQTALESMDKADKLLAIIEREGWTSKTEKTGTIHKHPLIDTEIRAREQFLRLWKMLDLDFQYLNQ